MEIVILNIPDDQSATTSCPRSLEYATPAGGRRGIHRCAVDHGGQRRVSDDASFAGSFDDVKINFLPCLDAARPGIQCLLLLNPEWQLGETRWGHIATPSQELAAAASPGRTRVSSRPLRAGW